MFVIKSFVSPSSSKLWSVQSRCLSLLSNLKPSNNSTRNHKRVGRGPSSGYGKTSGRGQKGQKARGTVKPWFEGGQTPITKLFPKIGFKRVNAPELAVLNLERVMRFHRDGRLVLKEGEVLNMRKMKQLGLITGTLRDGVKVLASGKEKFNLPLRIEATRASTEAIRAIERAGGEFTARYFTKLSLKAHLYPEYFFFKRGYIPLSARPTKKRDVHYYSRVDKRGYLVKENHHLYQAIQNAKTSKPKKTNVTTEGMETLGSTVNDSAYGFQTSGVMKLSDLNL